jgi:AI-2 transport protein TqsA
MSDRLPPWRDPTALRTGVYALVGVAAGWWLLGQLAGVVRPLLLAAFLCYVLLPYYAALRRRGVPSPVALGLLAGVGAAAVAAIALTVYGSLLGLSDQLPELKRRAVELFGRGTDYLTQNVPWLFPSGGGGKRPEEQFADGAADLAKQAVNVAAGGVLEAATAGLYLIFLLLGAERLPDRVRQAYPAAEADRILHVAGRVNAAIVGYLRAKVQGGLFLAVPVGLVLVACGVKFALLWAVLTFLLNFIPYIGVSLAYAMPVVFGFLQLGIGPSSVTAAGLVLALHVVAATVVEPRLIGRAVGLSPLVILAALALWGSVWGLPGMFLAVPLTVVGKLAMEQFEATRPVAKLAEE